MAGITKDDVSDIQGMVERLVQCELAEQRAALATCVAKNELDALLFRLTPGMHETA